MLVCDSCGVACMGCAVWVVLYALPNQVLEFLAVVSCLFAVSRSQQSVTHSCCLIDLFTRTHNSCVMAASACHQLGLKAPAKTVQSYEYAVAIVPHAYGL